jgi:tripartite-type tricarboxylate transporter receptor subunit TctC
MKMKILSALSLLLFFWCDWADAQPYYQGRTIRVIVGYQAGDSHDQLARATTRHMGKHIPGSPDFVVQNMPGGGSMIAANHLYNLTKPDGLTIGALAVVVSKTATERGEVVCRAISIDGYFSREPYLSWLKTGFVRVLLQTSRERDHRIPDVPTFYELLMDKYKTPAPKRRLATAYLGVDAIGQRPLASTPGLSDERVKILREAHSKTMEDPEFLMEAKKRGWEIKPVSGEQLETITKDVVDQPPDVVEWLKKLLGK